MPEPINAKTPTLGTTVSVWTASFYKRINRLDSTASLCIVLKRQVKGNILIGWAAAVMMPCLGGVADLDLTVDLNATSSGCAFCLQRGRPCRVKSSKADHIIMGCLAKCLAKRY